MKRLALLFVLFCASAFAQSVSTRPLVAADLPANPAAPALTPDQKIAILEATHKRDLIARQQSDLGLQVAQLQQQVQQKIAQLQDQLAKADADLDKAVSEATKGIDAKKWTLNRETLAYVEVPAETGAKPESKSTEQAKK